MSHRDWSRLLQGEAGAAWLLSFVELLTEAEAKDEFYTRRSLVIKYFLLFAALAHGNHSRGISYAAEAAKRMIEDHYRTAPQEDGDFPNGHPSRGVAKGERGGSVYSLESGPYVPPSGAEVFRAEPLVLKQCIPRRVHLYVIDNDGVGWLYATNLLPSGPEIHHDFERVIHPMLVPSGASPAVLAAGEIFLVSGEGNVIGAVVNNKSGHFRPGKRSLDIAREIFSKSLGLQKDMIIGVNVCDLGDDNAH